jgi:hypothetical protein
MDQLMECHPHNTNRKNDLIWSKSSWPVIHSLTEGRKPPSPLPRMVGMLTVLCRTKISHGGCL